MFFDVEAVMLKGTDTRVLDMQSLRSQTLVRLALRRKMAAKSAPSTHWNLQPRGPSSPAVS